MAIGALAVDMATPDSPAGYLLGAVSVLLGIVISASAGYLVAATNFWLVETRGVAILYMVASGFLAGRFVPIDLFPGCLHAVATAMPFPSMLMYPVDVLSGRVTGMGAIALVALQVLWLTVVIGVGQALTRAGSAAWRRTRPAPARQLGSALTKGPKQQGAPAGTVPGRLTIGWGRRDLVTLPRQAARATKLFPDAVLHWFERCGHFPQWNAPREATRLILDSTD